VYFKLDSTDLLLQLHGYLQWEGLAIFIGLLGAYCLRLYRPIATGFISLSHRLRKPEVIGFVSLIDHYDVQFKVVGIGPLTPPTPTSTHLIGRYLFVIAILP
jgi:hypothetical protein